MKAAMAALVLRGGRTCRELWPAEADLRSDREVGCWIEMGPRGTTGVGTSHASHAAAAAANLPLCPTVIYDQPCTRLERAVILYGSFSGMITTLTSTHQPVPQIGYQSISHSSRSPGYTKIQDEKIKK
jgi:hypothetical protein